MKAIVFTGQKRLAVAELPDPTPGPGEVVIAIRASGMCGSDLHTYRGPAREPLIAGHEPAGDVVAVGSGVSEEWLDRPVMVHHYFGCTRCDQCRQGWTQLCRAGATAMGNTAPGSHADLIKVPLYAVAAMPEALSYLAAAAIGCGTGTAWGAICRMHIHGDDTLAVFGQGPVGLAATQLASAMGARVIALDISQERLERAKAFGAWQTINPNEIQSVPDAIRDLNGGRGASKTLETSGSSAAAKAAIDCLDVWGVVCWVGVGSTVDFNVGEELPRQLTGMTSWTMSSVGMEACARFVVERGIDVDALFTDRWALSDGARAYQLFDLQTSGKGVFVPN